MTLVKICGITNLDDAQHAIECDSDQLGFNFYEKSSRYISSSGARNIVGKLPAGCLSIGVFVNKKLEEVLEIVNFVGLDGIQLHGEEDTAYIEELMQRTDKLVTRAFRISSAAALEDAKGSLAPYVLLDGFSPDERGGTGISFDWNIARDISNLRPGSVYLAGGLTPENVADAIRTVRPYAVDVASGVESTPGTKDPDKVAAFIKAAKEAL
jgi:phosphoribosylanthranilate isomerase